MAETFKTHNGSTLTTSVATLLTFGSGLVDGGARLMGVTLINTGSTDRLVTIYHVPSGDTAAASNVVWRGTVPANDTIVAVMNPSVRDSSSFVQGLQSVGTDVTVHLFAIEETA